MRANGSAGGFRLRHLAVALACALGVAAVTPPMAHAQAAQQAVQHYDISAGDLGTALNRFSDQSGLQVLFDASLVRGRTAPAVQGRFGAREALARLLQGSGLEASYVNDRTVILKKAPNRPKTPTSKPEQRTEATQTKETATELEPIIVTGTRIRGIGKVENLPAPAVTLTREELLESGIARTEDAFRFLPQNFDSHTTEAAFGTGNTTASNAVGSTRHSIDLRGLGPASTLILVNGRRRSARNAVNINTIPLSMLEKVEIVTGGRSAMYGSDAVGGVVNLVMRRDYQGMELQTEYGVAANGEPRRQASVLAGVQRDRGGVLFGYSNTREEQFDAADTGFLVSPDLAQRTYTHLPLRPELDQHSANLAARYSIGQHSEVFLEGLHTVSDTRTLMQSRAPGAAIDSVLRTSGESQEFDYTAGWQTDLQSWRVTADVHFSAVKFDSDSDEIDATAASTSLLTGTSRRDDRETTVGLQGEGPLPEVAGVRPRLAVGVEHRRAVSESKESLFFNGFPFALPDSHLERVTKAVFAELHLPLVVSGKRPGLRGLDLSLAARVEDYDDFGRVASPQFGVVWSVAESVALRASYSRAFRAPPLQMQLRPTGRAIIWDLSDPMQSDNTSPVLFSNSAKPDIGAEKARTWSTGFDWRIPGMRNGKLSVDYFEIDYRDRIAIPATGSDVLLALQREDAFGELINRSPTAADIDDYLRLNPRPLENLTNRPIAGPIDGASILAAFPDLVLFDNMEGNLSEEVVRGLDVSFRGEASTAAGDIGFGLSGSRTFDHYVRITPHAPKNSRIDEVAKPLSLRLRANLGWSRGPWSAHAYLNYAPSYDNPYPTPVERMDSWTTLDLTVGFKSGSRPRLPMLRDWHVMLAARNLFDEDPPLMGGNLVFAQRLRYDPTNANAEGRVVTLRLMREF